MYEDVCYAKNYVKEVICRLDFASENAEINALMPKEINQVMKKYFPIAEPEDEVSGELQINPLNQSTTINQFINKKWVYRTRDRIDFCTITKSAMFFSINKYDKFDEIYEYISAVVNAYFAKYPDAAVKRLGLRYINSIPLQGRKNLINSKYMDAMSVDDSKNLLRQLMLTEYGNLDKDIYVNSRLGFENKDYPASMISDDFIIDIDAYTKSIAYGDEILAIINNMHEEIQDNFENIITDDMRKELNTNE